MVEGVLQPDRCRNAGTDAQRWSGGPASPLLANILLDDLDKELERRGLHFVRTLMILRSSQSRSVVPSGS